VGDPTPAESIELARACVRAGADMLELGVPFSDPSADGPAIARASQRAIAAGGGLEATLQVSRALRDGGCTVPIVLFGYYNPIFVRGEREAARAAKEAGVDAMLVVDLPIEEATPLGEALGAHGLSFVPLLAPTSSGARLTAVTEAAKRFPIGFVYYVSMTGVTGAAGLRADEATARAAELKRTLGLPVVVGFGIDSAEKARAAAQHADGAVVGTALVKAIEDGTSAADRIARVERLVTELRSGLS
jgi:tryptophan synthase alpha chain